MGSDRARISYDDQQQYRAVVAQQGRVTVEADWNEAQQLVYEEIREETLDIVGPSGTPDDGYRVIETGKPATPPFDFSVQAGTLYVGGIRTALSEAIPYKQQTDWLDWQEDPDWVGPFNSDIFPKQEFIYLHLREQEVSAVEDSALQEVALGGPDTAQRQRLVQHIVRLETEANDCASALASAVAAWKTRGLTFNPATMRLESDNRLQVGFQTLVTTPDPCEPASQGGYLGADNQLIRVQISFADPKAEKYRLIWGVDNASFLYRVDAVNAQTLRLQARPVDSFHQPRTNQAVEVLRSGARLSNGEYIAAATGLIATLATPYVPDTQTVTLPGALPASYHPALTPRLFLRVWEEEKSFTPGTPIDLGTTGLQITLTTTGQSFHVGDYWQIAVRPRTPTAVYPQRYLNAPQPPDGPRLWTCPLAAITWTEGILKVLEDCRNPFDNLVKLTRQRGSGCCTVRIRPQDVAGGRTLQSVLDQLRNQTATVCLAPGTYLLSEPLRLDAKHINLTLEGCHDGVILQVAPEANPFPFLDGLIVLTQTSNITLHQLRLELPTVPFAEAVTKFGSLDPELLKALLLGLPNLRAAIGVRLVDCMHVTIRDCIFHSLFPVELDVFGAGIFAGGNCKNLTIQGNRFVNEPPPPIVFVPRDRPPILDKEFSPAGKSLSVFFREGPESTQTETARPSFNLDSLGGLGSILREAGASTNLDVSQVVREQLIATLAISPGAISLVEPRLPFRSLFGYLHLPYGTITSTVGSPGSVPGRSAQVMGCQLKDAVFQDNWFTGLSFAVLVISDFGEVKLEDNTVRESRAGIWLEPLSVWSSVPTFLAVVGQDSELYRQLLTAMVFDPVVLFGVELALFYPLPQKFKPSKAMVPVNFSTDVSLQGSLLEVQPFFTAAHTIGLLSLDVHCTDNRIDVLLPNDNLSSIGLLILPEWPQETEQVMNSNLIANSNKIRNRAPNAPTVVLMPSQRCTITGNLFENLAPGPNPNSNVSQSTPFSLFFRFVHQQFAITGNVLLGKSTLGMLSRSDLSPLPPPPMDTWLFLNTEITVGQPP